MPSSTTSPAVEAKIRLAPPALTADASPPTVPAWCFPFAGIDLGLPAFLQRRGVSLRAGKEGVLASVRIADAVSLPAERLDAAVAEAYGAIESTFQHAATLDGLAATNPVRFWNFIPGIHETMDSRDGSPSRYMVFNAGRYRAMERWRAGGRLSGTRINAGVAAATGIGCGGNDLFIHGLAWPGPGHAVENPRQVPAYRYSRKYGPLPPCFARGTVLGEAGRRTLLISGTASVRGEDSVHIGEGAGVVWAQVVETLENIAGLVGAAFGVPARAAAGLLSDLRVYAPRPADLPLIERLVRERVGNGTAVELIQADICRPELRVEIEGIAREGAGTGAGEG